VLSYQEKIQRLQDELRDLRAEAPPTSKHSRPLPSPRTTTVIPVAFAATTEDAGHPLRASDSKTSVSSILKPTAQHVSNQSNLAISTAGPAPSPRGAASVTFAAGSADANALGAAVHHLPYTERARRRSSVFNQLAGFFTERDACWDWLGCVCFLRPGTAHRAAGAATSTHAHVNRTAATYPVKRVIGVNGLGNSSGAASNAPYSNGAFSSATAPGAGSSLNAPLLQKAAGPQSYSDDA